MIKEVKVLAGVSIEDTDSDFLILRELVSQSSGIMRALPDYLLPSALDALCNYVFTSSNKST